jgi:hypothetical protein
MPHPSLHVPRPILRRERHRVEGHAGTLKKERFRLETGPRALQGRSSYANT